MPSENPVSPPDPRDFLVIIGQREGFDADRYTAGQVIQMHEDDPDHLPLVKAWVADARPGDFLKLPSEDTIVRVDRPSYELRPHI
jgi:hypothetical protein